MANRQMTDMDRHMQSIAALLASRRDGGLPADPATNERLARTYMSRPAGRAFLPDDPTGNASNPLDWESRRRAANTALGQSAQVQQKKPLFKENQGGIEEMMRLLSKLAPKTNSY